MDEAAQDVGSLEVRAVGLTGRSRSGVAGGRCLLTKGPVRTVPVVVPGVLAGHGFEMTSSEDEHAVEALSPRPGPAVSSQQATNSRTVACSCSCRSPHGEAKVCGLSWSSRGAGGRQANATAEVLTGEADCDRALADRRGYLFD